MTHLSRASAQELRQYAVQLSAWQANGRASPRPGAGGPGSNPGAAVKHFKDKELRFMKVKELLELLRGCNPEADAFISMDVSTGPDDADHRFFGDIVEVISNDPNGVPVLCEKTEQNFND